MVEGSRSLNLANAVAVVVYDTWRRHGYRISRWRHRRRGAASATILRSTSYTKPIGRRWHAPHRLTNRAPDVRCRLAPCRSG